MATRAEQFHAEEQRKKKQPLTDDTEATFSRPSKAERNRAKRVKPDTGLIAREQLQKGSPTARYRKANPTKR